MSQQKIIIIGIIFCVCGALVHENFCGIKHRTTYKI